MIGSFFHSVIYLPIYNALAAAVSAVPGGDVGLAVILITVCIKLLLFPLALKASQTQREMRVLEPKLKEIREQHKGNNEALARATLELYRAHRINPFASFLTLFIQIPVILGLYWVILAEAKAATFDPTLLYSFVPVPESASFIFLGILPLAGSSLVLAGLVGITQFIQAWLMMPAAPASTGKQFQDDLAKSMHLQMRFVFPIILAVVGYIAGSAIALYFITSNMFGIVQELIADRTKRKVHP